MMIKKPGLALLVAFCSVFGLSQTAAADDCEDYIEELQEFVEDDLCRNRRMCVGLSHKLDNALHKLDQGKVDHAVRRLQDFSATIDTLSATRKNSRRSRRAIDSEVHDEMRPYIAKAIMCILNDGDFNDDDDDDDDEDDDDRVVGGDTPPTDGGTPADPPPPTVIF